MFDQLTSLNMVSFVLIQSALNNCFPSTDLFNRAQKIRLNLVISFAVCVRLCSKNRRWQRAWRHITHPNITKNRIPNGPLNVGTLFFFVDEMCIATNCDSQHCFVWLRGMVFASYYMRFYYWPLALCIRRDNNMLIKYIDFATISHRII